MQQIIMFHHECIIHVADHYRSFENSLTISKLLSWIVDARSFALILDLVFASCCGREEAFVGYSRQREREDKHMTLSQQKLRIRFASQNEHRTIQRSQNCGNGDEQSNTVSCLETGLTGSQLLDYAQSFDWDVSFEHTEICTRLAKVYSGTLVLLLLLHQKGTDDSNSHPLFQSIVRFLKQCIQSSQSRNTPQFLIEYFCWIIILTNEKVLSVLPALTSSDPWLIFLCSVFGRVQHSINFLFVGGSNEGSNMAIISNRLKAAWLSMEAFVRYSYQHMEVNDWPLDKNLNVHHISIDIAMHILKYFVIDVRRSGPVSISGALLSFVSSILEKLTENVVSSSGNGKIDSLWLLASTCDIFELLMREMCDTMEAVLLSTVLPQISDLVYNIDTRYSYICPSSTSAAMVRLTIICEENRENTASGIRWTWLRQWSDFLNNASLMVDTLLRNYFASGNFSQLLDKDAAENKSKVVATIANVASSAAMIASTVQVSNRPLAARIHHIGYHMTESWISLLKSYSLENVDLSVQNRLVGFFYVRILDSVLPFAQGKSNRKLRLTEISTLKAAIDALPSIRIQSQNRQTSTIVDSVLVKAYFAACMTICDVFPEASLILLGKLWRGRIECVSGVGDMEDDETFDESYVHFLEFSLSLAEVLMRERITEKFPEEILEFVLCPILDALPCKVHSLHKQIWNSVLQMFRTRGNVAYADIYAGYICSRLAFFSDERQQKFQQLCPTYQRNVSVTHSLIRAYPNMIYYLLMSEEIGEMPVKVLITENVLVQRLEMVASALEVPSGILSEEELDNPSAVVLSDSIFDHNMSLLVWSFGCEASESVRNRALQAMKVLCMIRKRNAWQIAEEPSRKRSLYIEQETEDNFIEMISKQFLFIVARLLQHNWTSQSIAHQEHGLRCLNGLLDYLTIDETIKYLPKVVIILDSAISSSSGRLRYEAVKLTQLLCRKLPYEILKQSIPTLVYNLYFIVEGKIPRPAKNASTVQSTTSRNEESNTEMVSLLALFCSLETDFFGDSISSKLDLPGNSLREAEFIEQAKLWSVDIIKMIFISNKMMYEDEFQASPYIPNIPELQSLRRTHELLIQEMTLQKRMAYLTSLIRHENPNVRSLALQNIRETLSQRRSEIYEILSASSVNTSGSTSDHVIAFLLRDLLMLTISETVDWVKEECARCLGEIGCFDPSYLRVKIGTYHKEKLEKDQHVYPWNITIQEFTLHMLVEYMVPGLKSTQGSGAQDRCGLAIQELLQVLLQQYASGIGASRGQQTPLAIVSQALQRRNVLEIVEPFLTSKYFMENKIVPPTPPIYQPGMPCKRWVFLFCRYLVTVSVGSFKPIFEASQAVLRHQTDLGQFLLPYLILDVVLQNDQERINVITKELSSILGDAEHQQQQQQTTDARRSFARADANEPVTMTVNRTGLEASDTDSCVQAVFSLLDTFFAWEKFLRKNDNSVTALPESSKGKSSNRGKSDENDGYFGTEAEITLACQLVLSSMPLTLLSQAAFATKAYARALKYLEQNARQRALLQQSTSSAALADTSASNANAMQVPVRKTTSSVLPTLTLEDIDSLADIYSLLEDPDSLHGVQVLRRSYGFPETIIHRIVELELNDDWLGALLEYELLQNSRLYQTSLINLRPLCHQSAHHYVVSSNIRSSILNSGSSGRKKPILRMDSIAVMNRRRNPPTLTTAKSTPAGFIRAASDPSSTVGGMEELNMMDFDDIAEIERGKLRCLIELGHLESTIYHTEGKSGVTDSLQRSMLSLGTEAAWRLSKWDSLDEFLSIADQCTILQQGNKRVSLFDLVSESDSYQLRLGKAISCLRVRDSEQFQWELSRARLQTISTLATASMESYARSYPMLERLHILTELEMGRELLQICYPSSSSLSSSSSSSSSAAAGVSATDQAQALAVEYLRRQHWQERVSKFPESMIQKSHLMAVRRAVLGICGLHKEIGQNWFDVSELYVQLGRFDSARYALKNAEQYAFDPELVLLEECKILRKQGQLQRALILLEPNPIDTSVIMAHLKINRRQKYPGYLDTEEKKSRLAKRLLLATEFLVEAKQSQPPSILERYRTIVALDKSNHGKVFFDYGKYYEFLYKEHVSKEQSDDGINNLRTSHSILSSNSAGEMRKSHHYLEKIIEKFGNCLMLNEKLSPQVLPRLLTHWLTFTAKGDAGAAVATSVTAMSSAMPEAVSRQSTASVASSTINETALSVAQRSVNKKMEHLCTRIPPRIWFNAIQQIVSNILHRNKETVNLLIRMIVNVLVAYPKQGVWHIANLIHSSSADRKLFAKKILQDVQRELSSSNSPEDAQMFADCPKLFHRLIQLAEFQTKEKKISWSIDTRLKLSAFLVPTKTVLMESGLSALPLANQASSGMMYIQKFNESVDVASSKAKPKTITLETTCGHTIKFLCKQEKDGDLRKDARLMEFNTTVNRLLQEDSQGRKRKLLLRTYAVVCLNEVCGVLEWVNNTSCLRHVVNDAHAVAPDLYPNITYKEIYHQYLEYQDKLADDIPGMARAYEALIAASGYRPCLHIWFLDKFSDPTEWLEARTTFARSAAVWSGVGHIIGLGDRHTENILLNTTTGECVHVDFDCLFDKGLNLLKPEIVPFRLTPNIVDAMGVTGVEGCFRKSLEVCLTVLRDNKETLLSVLEPFLQDPTVAWGRLGRARQSDKTATSRAATTANDHEAKDTLQRIEDRLKGIYNIHPHRGTQQREQAALSRGIDSGKEDFLPLSVTGQTQKLIDEAISIENIAQMYIGWQPWI